MARIENLDERRHRTNNIIAILKKLYPGANCALIHKNPFELLVATVLSAQCTDARVNQVTPELFKKFPDAASLSKGSAQQVETLIRSTGFYVNKTKSLLGLSKDIVEKHRGKVPCTMEELVALRGVGRKTANVVLGNAFGIPGLVVDTHVGRLCRRLGLTKKEDPEKVELEMMELVPKKEWIQFSHWLILHGRAVCQARKPNCLKCKVRTICPSAT